jgi:hypothetical protein
MWPDVRGAQSKIGHVCVTQKRSRSKYCNTLVGFFNPDSSEVYWMRANEVKWSSHPSTLSVLLNALGKIALEKDSPGAFSTRGMMVGRLIGMHFHMFEAVRGKLFPRWTWQLPLQIHDWAEVLSLLIDMESAIPHSFVGTSYQGDQPVQLPVRFHDGLVQYGHDLINARVNRDSVGF